MCCLYFFLDKKVSDDKLISAFAPHFLGIHFSKKTIEPSFNPVYLSIKEDLGNGKGVILVVWESLGVPNNPIFYNELKKLHLHKVEKIHWEGGSTVPAEMRYLCGTNYGLFAEKCLPKLTDKSYAMHGNSLAYFSRSEMYSDMGFQNSIGKNSLSTRGKDVCHYAYSAICDEDLLDELLNIAIADKCNGLFYALTIDSHFPYLKYIKHDSGLFDDLNKFIIKAKYFKSQHTNCQIYIVGDHPPAFSNNFNKKNIFFIKF